MGNTRDTGYLQNIVQYDASNNITLPANLTVTSNVAINNTTPHDTTQFSLDINGGLIVKNTGKTAQFVIINSNPATGGNHAFVQHTVGGTSGSSYADIQGYYGLAVTGSTVIRLNPLGGNVLIGSLVGTGTRVVVASSTGVLSTQAAQTIGDLNGVPTSRTITINGTTQDLSADRTFTINSMVYPGAGIAVSTGSTWGTSLTDNSSNWNTAYGWGNHAGLYSLLNHTHTFASLTSKPTTLVGYGITDAATSAQGTSADTAYGWGNHASGGYVTLTGTQTISGVKTFSTYQLMDVAILIKHGSNTSTGGYTGIGSVASGLTINLGIGTTGSLLFNTSASYSYTFPAASGTIALTSDLSTYATQTYVGTQIANLVASSPAALDTLNELATALGNDAAFSTTVSTALGNRLRVDINTQGLSATLQGYGRTNLGLGTAATANTGDFVAYRTFGTAANSATGDFVAYRTFGTAANNNTGDFAAASHTHSIADVTGLQTALDGKQASGSYAASVHTHIISDVTGLQTALDGKQASLGFTPYNSTNPSGYISSSGSISGTAAYATQWGTSAGYANFSSTAISASVGWLFGTTGNGTYAPVSLASVATLLGLGSLAYSSATIPTNNNQLTNGAGYVTTSGLSTDADSEQDVGGRYFRFNNGINRINIDPRWNESGYDADMGVFHMYSTTAAGVQWGRTGIALYNGSAYQYITTKASTTGLFVNNTQVVTNSGTWGISITGNAATSTIFNNGSLYISTVNGNTLNSGYSNAGDGSDIWINYRGYNDAQSYFRDFRVGDGKGAQVALFTGSNKSLAITGAISASNLSGTNTGDQTNISGNAATASSVAWSGVSSGYRENYVLGFRPSDNSGS